MEKASSESKIQIEVMGKALGEIKEQKEALEKAFSDTKMQKELLQSTIENLVPPSSIALKLNHFSIFSCLKYVRFENFCMNVLWYSGSIMSC